MIPKLFMGTAWAQSTAMSPDFDFTSLFIKMLLLLLLIMALGFLLLRFVKRSGSWHGKGQDNHFELLSWYRLEPKKSVYIIRIGKKIFALGVSDHNVNLLGELKPSDLSDD